MTLKEIGDLILSPQAELLSQGNYINRRGIRGYYLQVKCADHWCKISVSHADDHSAWLTVAELDEIVQTALLPGVIIPTPSIAAALKSRVAEEAPTHTYVNNAGVEGFWADLSYNGNWYMISMSHIDVPAYASSEELDRIADEFLKQQGERRIRQGRD
jgi:hypothetical protein